jgi:hypothetical protein
LRDEPLAHPKAEWTRFLSQSGGRGTQFEDVKKARSCYMPLDRGRRRDGLHPAKEMKSCVYWLPFSPPLPTGNSLPAGHQLNANRRQMPPQCQQTTLTSRLPLSRGSPNAAGDTPGAGGPFIRLHLTLFRAFPIPQKTQQYDRDGGCIGGATFNSDPGETGAPSTRVSPS